MSEEEKLSLNSYIEVLFQGFQFGDILFDAEHSMELYNLINKVLNENQKLKKQLEIKHDGFMASVEESCELAKENQELKKQLEVGEQQYNDLVEEKEKLQEQLDYLRSGEYYNQLRFENEMLQNVVDTNGVPSEVYDYIDCVHRNTELLEENEQLKKELEQSNAVANTNKELAESFHKENERLKSLLKCDYEDNQEIMADIIKEKQELIDYLKEEIDKYEQSICKILKENDSGWGDIGFYEETRKLSDTYFKMKEILSKIESGEK